MGAGGARGAPGPQKGAGEQPEPREELYCDNKQSLRNHGKTLTIISQWLVV